MILRANSALQTACQRGRALFHGLATQPRNTGAAAGSSRPAIAADTSEEPAGKPYRGAAILANTRRRGASFPGSRIRAGTAQPWSFVRPRLRWHTGCRMFGSMDFRNPSMNLLAHKPKPPVEEPTPDPDERSPVEEPDRPDPRSPPERPRR